MAVQTQIQTRRGAAATWTSTNPTLAAGEIGFESDTNKFKIGTGSTAWASLPYAASISPLTTKGDLYTYSTADARLAVGANGETLVADSSTSTGLKWQGDYAAGKNFVINGNMNISQRGTSLASLSTGESYLVDRFCLRNNNLGTATFSQETDAPAGFKTSAKILFTTADATPAASDFAYFRHKIESQALQSLQKGTATAKPITISFWVKSNVTGTYILQNYDPVNGRIISGSYSINTANTWEKKSITLVGDTSGALDNNNVTGLQIGFALGAGSDRTSGTLDTSWGSLVTANEQVGQVNVAAAVDNYWMITGVQVEIGSVATEFQLSTGTIQGELAACQRYYEAYVFATNGLLPAQAISANATYGSLSYKVPKRGTPTIAATGGTFQVLNATGTAVAATFQADAISTDTARVAGVSSSGLVAGNAASLFFSSMTITISAEL